jgi:hypothetical protein
MHSALHKRSVGLQLCQCSDKATARQVVAGKRFRLLNKKREKGDAGPTVQTVQALLTGMTGSATGAFLAAASSRQRPSAAAMGGATALPICVTARTRCTPRLSDARPPWIPCIQAYNATVHNMQHCAHNNRRGSLRATYAGALKRAGLWAGRLGVPAASNAASAAGDVP